MRELVARKPHVFTPHAGEGVRKEQEATSTRPSKHHTKSTHKTNTGALRRPRSIHQPCTAFQRALSSSSRRSAAAPGDTRAARLPSGVRPCPAVSAASAAAL